MNITAKDRNAWLAARRTGITGTDIAAILGLNPWKNAIDVYLDKIGQGRTVEQNEAMWWGTYLEDGMARRYAEITGLKKGELLRGASIAAAFPKKRVAVFGKGQGAQVLIRHKEYPFLLATCDGLLPAHARGLELKTAGIFGADEWGEQGTDQVPVHYLTQCAHYMAVADFGIWDLGALIGIGKRISGNLALYQLHRNRALENELIATAVRFWKNHVLKRQPPQIDGSAGWQAYLSKKYAKSTGVVLKASSRISELATQYRAAQEKRQQAEADELLVRNRLAAIVASADKAQGDFGTVGWVRPGPKEVTDWEALARSLRPTAGQLSRFTRPAQDSAYLRAWWKKEWVTND
jgi:predicted phage-related endonuclease